MTRSTRWARSASRTPSLPLAIAVLAAVAPAGPHAVGLGGEGTPGPAPEPDAVEDESDVQQTVVTAARAERDVFRTPAAVSVVSADDIRSESFRTTPQALREIPSVMVQETSPGQGSPYIRGFTGFRNLFLIDGIRLNNSVFRDGPNQYWNTVDALSIERLEVVKGPSSVLYGSDAIGGTVNAITKDPFGLSRGGGLGARAYYRFSEAEQSHMGRLEAGGALGDDTGVLLGLSLKDFGDVRGGEDVGTQPGTGYEENDADVKVERLLDPHTRLVVAHQRVRQDDVPRTHRTVDGISFEGTTVGSDRSRVLDQERDLTYVQLIGDEGSALGRSRISLSFHEQAETRNRVRGNGAFERQGFDVGTFGLFAHFGGESPIGELTWGVDYYHDDVESFSSTNPVQGPVADDATYDRLGVFLQDEIEATESLDLTLGGRFEYAAADADRVADPVSGNPIAIDEDWGAFVASARFLYELVPDEWNLFGGVSQGFRAPNLSDLTRFDSARTNEFEVPSPDLDPERFVSFELGARTRGADHTAEASVYYTDITDQIVRFPTGNVNGAGEFEITKDNVGDGYVYGIELSGSWRFAEHWTVLGNAAYQDGRVETFPTSAQVVAEEPIDRLMPFTARLGLRWEDARDWVELDSVFADDADRLSTRDQSDTSRIPPGGTPAYGVLHLRAGRRVTEDVTVYLGLQNVLDEDYRVHGSGSNMPGRGVLVGLDVSF